MKKTKALVLLSGGLDSRLCAKILQEQGIEVTALHFILPFLGCCKPDCSFKFTQLEGIKLKIIDCTKGRNFQEYIQMIKKPKHGYGSAINPCIDCHILMLKKAKQIMNKEKADFIATGEVLNERPMSQHIRALKIIEEESSLKGKLLRPLSAKLLEETEAEKKKLVDREKLLAIHGRIRKPQMDLAKKYKISYPLPAGGCLLCEEEFAKKIKDLFKHKKKLTQEDINLLRLGRHFRINDIKVVVGRNEKENKELQKIAESNIIMEVKDIPSPLTIIEGKADSEILKKAAALTMRYSDVDKGIVIYGKNKMDKEIKTKSLKEEEIEKMRIK